MTISKYTILGGLALFVMFLPRKLELFGMFSFRLFILLLALLAFVLMKKPLRFSGMQCRPFYYMYLLILLGGYLMHMEIVSMIGFLTDVFVLYLLLGAFLDSKKDIDYFVMFFLRVLVIYALMCVLETLTGFNIWSMVGVSVSTSVRFGLQRCSGAFTVSGNNGMFLLLCFPFIWYVKEATDNKKLANTANLLVWLALLGTMTRAAILAAVGLHVFVLWRTGIMNFLRRHGIKILAGGILFFLALTIIPPLRGSVKNITTPVVNMFVAMVDPSVAEEITDEFGSNARGTGERVELYTWVWEEVKDNKWTGMGPNAKFSYLWVVPTSKKIAIKTSIENFYLATLYRFGILGLVALLLFFAQELFTLTLHSKAEKKYYTRNSATFASRVLITVGIYFAALLTISAVDDYRMFFILIAVEEAYHRAIINSVGQQIVRVESGNAGNQTSIS